MLKQILIDKKIDNSFFMGFNYQIIITVVITILRIGGKSISVVTRMIPKMSRLVFLCVAYQT